MDFMQGLGIHLRNFVKHECFLLNIAASCFGCKKLASGLPFASRLATVDSPTERTCIMRGICSVAATAAVLISNTAFVPSPAFAKD